MTLTIKTPQLPSCDFHPQIEGLQQIPAYPTSETIDSTRPRDQSPTPPEFSPITPKTHPAILAVTNQQPNTQSTTVDPATIPAQQNGETGAPAIAPTQYITPPPSQPFSSDESIDGLALKAAISSLQFQRQRAREDIKSLDQVKKLALADPERFTKELVSGRLREKRHAFGNDEDVLDAQNEERDMKDAPDDESMDTGPDAALQSFQTLPGPQSVVRMPHVNWNKYHMTGELLDALHEQQRRWPGSSPFQQNKGREFSVTAPYSPFYDSVDGQPGHARNASDGSRKESNTPGSVAGTPVNAEHPYETRRNSKHQAQ